MKSRGAILRDVPGKFEVVDLVVDEPRRNEIRVKMVAAGLCHSDVHMATGDTPVLTFPFCGGHEGGGVVESVGPDTEGFEPGEKVIFNFLPVCGRCQWCSTGHQNLCDLGAGAMIGARWEDPTSFRMALPDGTPVGQALGVSTFAEYTTVSTMSAVKVPDDTPLEKACLVGCAVGTGWGSAVNTGGVHPGDTVVIFGIGGIGSMAVQGAVHAGASRVIVVDPVELKRETALALGAAFAVATADEAIAIAKAGTNGQGADVAIVTVGFTEGEHVAQAVAAIRKRGTVVVTGMGAITDIGVPVSLFELTTMEKTIRGSLFGSSNPLADIPKLVELYRRGQLKLDELITAEYALDDIAQGFEDMLGGKNVRGVVRF